MNATFRILATLTLVLSILGSIWLLVYNGDMASKLDMSEVPFGLGGMIEKLAASSGVPPAEEWRFAMYFAIALTVFSVVTIITTFMKNPAFGMVVAGVTGLLALLLIIFEPSIPGNNAGELNPKWIAIVVGVLAMAGAVCSGLSLRAGPGDTR